MKFLHLSDLHLGKQMNDVSLLADQEAVLLGQVVPSRGGKTWTRC